MFLILILISQAQTLAAKVKRMEEYQKEEIKKNKEREEKQRIQVKFYSCYYFLTRKIG